MVENNSDSKPQPKQSTELEFVESISKEEEAKLAAFLGKVTAGLSDGQGGDVPDAIGAQLNDWMQQLKDDKFLPGTKEEPNREQ